MTEPGHLDTDLVQVRVLLAADAERVARIDEALTGRARGEYFKRKIDLALKTPGVSLSFGAELDGALSGFLLGSVDYGEFGVLEPVAVLDAIGVHPDARRHHVATALLRQLTLQLGALHIERVRTEVDWRQLDLIGFLQRAGFTPAPRLCLEARVEALGGRRL